MNAPLQLELEGSDAATLRRARPPVKQLVLDALRTAGKTGLTVEELCKVLHMKHQQVSPRAMELTRACKVVPVAPRRTSTGRPAWAWALREFFDGADLDAVVELADRVIACGARAGAGE